MDGLGQLAYRKDGHALAYRKGGGALIYKGEPRPIDVVIKWLPKSYTCYTYNAYHAVEGAVTWTAEDGEATLVSSVVSSEEDNRLSFRVSGAARLRINMNISVHCAAEEYADNVMVWFAASQRGAEPAVKWVSPPGAPSSTASVVIYTDETGTMTEVQDG